MTGIGNPGFRRRENQTAMISLGIPKLVRFRKSRSDDVQVLNYLIPAIATRYPCALRRIRPNGWLAPRWSHRFSERRFAGFHLK
jgi:hypothetical protein